MRLLSDALILSPSDLMRFQGCQHASALDLRLLKGEPLQPAEDALEAQLLQVHGDRHEHNYLERLRAECRDVGVVEKDGASLDDAVALTDRLLKDGREIIFQAAFRQGRWAGYSDFLERVDRPSALGGYSYEVIDTKLKRRPDPKHVLQLMLYSDLLEAVQGLTPEHAHLVLGDGRRVSLRVRDFRSYSRRLKQRLEGFVSEPWPTRPEPVQACGLCRWREYCSRQWDDEDALCLVAGITKSQSQKLEAAGITTLTDLANREDRIPGLHPTT